MKQFQKKKKMNYYRSKSWYSNKGQRAQIHIINPIERKEMIAVDFCHVECRKALNALYLVLFFCCYL